ncbi:MAG: hypothetical protein F4Z68_00805 [Nitrospira sp. SB0667_bin_9]|nr:hypothetical protein [Nitrospira sp. SB0667_bin_9]
MTIKERFRKHLSQPEAVSLGLQAILSAAEEDLGTGGPDSFRGIYPTIKIVDAQGVRDVEESEVASQCGRLAQSRPGGES